MKNIEYYTLINYRGRPGSVVGTVIAPNIDNLEYIYPAFYQRVSSDFYNWYGAQDINGGTPRSLISGYGGYPTSYYSYSDTNSIVFAVPSGENVDNLLSQYPDNWHKFGKNIISGKYKFNSAFNSFVLPNYTDFRYLLNYTIIIVPCTFEFEGEIYDYFGVKAATNNTTTNYDTYYFIKSDKTFTTYKGGDIKDKSIDFGINANEIPDFVFNWIIENTEQIYDNSYIIKTLDGTETLSVLQEAPPMARASLSFVSKQRELSFVGVNNKKYSMIWENVIPDGKIFGGLSLTANNGKIYIPANGEEIDISLDGSTTLYESYQTYRPLEDPFTIMLYQNSSENHRVDKTDFLTELGGLSGIFRDTVNIVNPVVRIQSNEIPKFNYVKIGILNRYYYVTDYDVVRTGLIDLYLTEDVLMTYRDGIYKLKAFIERNEYENNPLLVDKKRIIEEGVNVETHSIENALMSETLFQPETDIRFVLNGYKIDSADESPV